MRVFTVAILLWALLINGFKETAYAVEKTTKEPTYVNFPSLAVKTAESYLYVREKGGANRGKEVDKFHNFAGLPYGNPWCLMFINYIWHESSQPYLLNFPQHRGARVSRFLQHAINRPYEYKVITSKSLVYGVNKLEAGDMPIWVKGANKTMLDNFNGHVGIVTKQLSSTAFESIEGNTSSGAGGNQRDGDGVYRRVRIIEMGSDFRVEAFVRHIFPKKEIKQ